MQTFLVALLIGVLSVYIVSGNSLKQWNTEGMVFPCGESRGKVEGSKNAMIYNCRGSSADGRRGAGANGGQGGISTQDVSVDPNGMFYAPLLKQRSEEDGSNVGIKRSLRKSLRDRSFD